jgi:DNA-binding MarR family transcriptional regulator
MTASISLTPRTIGETENALRALLMNALAGSPLDYPGWVTLRLIAESSEPTSDDAVATRLSDGLKIDREAAVAIVERLRANGLAVSSGDHIIPTPAGVDLHAGISSHVRSLTRHMWDGLSAEELAVTQRVLSRITERANALLAAHGEAA